MYVCVCVCVYVIAYSNSGWIQRCILHGYYPKAPTLRRDRKFWEKRRSPSDFLGIRAYVQDASFLLGYVCACKSHALTLYLVIYLAGSLSLNTYGRAIAKNMHNHSPNLILR